MPAISIELKIFSRRGFEPRPARALSPLAQQALWLITSGLAH